MKVITLLLVDDHEIVRMGLRTLFDRVTDISVVGEADSVASAVDQAARLNPDVVLMDMRLPDGSGIDACRAIRAGNPDARVLFITSFDDETALLAAILAGADGYLLKEISRNALLTAVRSVAAGNPILDPAATRKLLNHVQSPDEGKNAQVTPDALSAQEQRVLALVAQGKTNKEIASELDLSPRTVKNYLSNVFQKLQVSRRSEAAAIFAGNSANRNGSPEET